MGINTQEAKISFNTYLFLHEGSEPPCLQRKEELLWGFIQELKHCSFSIWDPDGIQKSCGLACLTEYLSWSCWS